jgi:hypothetical protein
LVYLLSREVDLVKALWILIALPLLAQQPQTAPSSPVPLPQRDLKSLFPGNPFKIANPAKLEAALKMQFVEKPPQTCAIPLLQVSPKGNFTMKVAKPPESFRPEPEVKVPAPACQNWNR